MIFSEFVNKYDFPGSVVLLEGKREVLEEDEGMLIRLGELLVNNTKLIQFRSGNADGSDFLFSAGVVREDNSRLEAIVPYAGHKSNKNIAYKTISLDEIDLMEEQELLIQSKKNKKMAKLIDQYAGGDRNWYAKKAAYIIRDTLKVIGSKDVPPASIGIFYDDLQNPRSGGTGHTMNMCLLNKIPFIDQRVWFSWLNP